MAGVIRGGKRTVLWALPLTLAGCGSGGVDDPGIGTVNAAEVVGVIGFWGSERCARPDAVAEGAIVGATVLGFNAGGFEAKIGDDDRSAAHLAYGRSESRSGQTVAVMSEPGFTGMMGASAFSDLAAAGRRRRSGMPHADRTRFRGICAKSPLRGPHRA